ncbi:glycosyltransferase family 2 protein [candidate division KSB1 bacterium]|nr:glycosyltransferase family 2 protein [candidate division KSB1 bacterium]
MRTLIIIPALNEEANITTVIEDIRIHAPDVDLVVVDDGSTDLTVERASEAGAIVLSLPFNLGIGGAVQTGFQYAYQQGYDTAIQIDADGQHAAAEIPKILEPLHECDCDVVIGSRFLETSGYKVPFTRMMGIRVFSFLNSLILRQKVTDNTSGFRAYNRKTIRFLAEFYPWDYPEPEAVVLLSRHGFRIREVPVQMRERQHGESSINAFRAIYYMIKVVLAILIDLLKERERIDKS